MSSSSEFSRNDNCAFICWRGGAPSNARPFWCSWPRPEFTLSCSLLANRRIKKILARTSSFEKNSLAFVCGACILWLYGTILNIASELANNGMIQQDHFDNETPSTRNPTLMRWSEFGEIPLTSNRTETIRRPRFYWLYTDENLLPSCQQVPGTEADAFLWPTFEDISFFNAFLGPFEQRF